MEDASLTTKGVVKLSSAVDSTSESLAATPKAVKAANDNANSRVPSNRKVNGKALTADIKLTPKDIGTLNSITMSFSGGAGWFKLATVTMPQASSIVYIALIGGAGYNVGFPHQAGISELVLRAGNGNPKGITGALWKRTAVGLTNFAWINTSGDTYDIYVEIGNYATRVNIHWDCTANATVSIYTSPTYSASKPSSVTDGVVYTMYSTHQKPTPLDIGALPTTGGTVSGPLSVTGGLTGSLNGNASTATKLQTARNINGVKFDGSGDININTLVSRGRVTALSGSTQGTAGIQMYEAYSNSYPTKYGNVLHMKGASAAGEGELLIGWSGTSGAHAPVFIRSRRDYTGAAWSAWAQVYTAKDSIPGVNTTGNQNTTGNAATATKLQTARKIAGVAFDGSADITLTAANLNAYTKTEVANLLSSYASRSSLTGYSGNLDIVAETLVVKSGGSGGFAIWDIGTTTSGANMYIDPNPGINTVWRSTSSRRYKKDIETLQDRYADELLSLRPVWYRSICRGDRKDWGYYGLIAEEVGEIAPQYVHWREPTNNDSPEDISSNGMVAEGVMYERLVVPLIHHIQQLTKRVEELETKLNSPKE
ncbi:TPA: hypothetical protein GFY11_04130 [Escherichia coli]|nr:hypothetical protein [Escherichia coli]